MKLKVSKSTVFIICLFLLTICSPTFYWWWSAQYEESSQTPSDPSSSAATVKEQVLITNPKVSALSSDSQSNKVLVTKGSIVDKKTTDAESNKPSTENNIDPEAQRKPAKPIPVTKAERVSGSSNSKYASFIHNEMDWDSFAKLPLAQKFSPALNPLKTFPAPYKLVQCPASIPPELAKKRLPDEDVKWCQWALSPQGANVVVGKSWGKLTSKSDKEKFDALNCNAVNNGKNPSCDDSWGDMHMQHWLENLLPAFSCQKGTTSKVQCYGNDNADMYCAIENAQIDFSKYKKVDRGNGMTPSKKFQQNFLSADCKPSSQPTEPQFSFPHLYSPQLASRKCDVVYNGTLLLYSHDDIRNLGHTLNDILNVWVMLWMGGLARYAGEIDMLNIDSFKLGHNFDDQPNAFFYHYFQSLHSIYKGIEFGSKTVCIKKLLIQPIPPRFFIWESWFVDLPCSFIGPSTLYQRWNLHVRDRDNLLPITATNERLKILLIVRNENSNMWGTQRTSRNFLNPDELSTALKTYGKEKGHDVVILDLGKLPFAEQLQLLATTSIMVGTHGAGIASSLHMSIGTKYCCGVLEIYPQGEFAPIKGHGNMARKMGIHYDRLDISGANSQGNGVVVPPQDLVQAIDNMVNKILQQPSCILPTVLSDPYLENVKY